MTTDASMDESVFGEMGVSPSLRSSAHDDKDQRKRHRSADENNLAVKGIFKSHKLDTSDNGDLKPTGETEEESPAESGPSEGRDGQLLQQEVERTSSDLDKAESDSSKNATVKDAKDTESDISSQSLVPNIEDGDKCIEKDNEADACQAEADTSTGMELKISSESKSSLHSQTSPAHSIRTPVTEDDPLGALVAELERGSTPADTSKLTTSTDSNVELLGSTSSEQNSEGSPKAVANRSNLLIELDAPFGGSSTPVKQSDDTHTNDSGIGDVKSSDSGGRLKIDSLTSSEASSPGSPIPEWKPVHQSQSDSQMDTGLPVTPSKGKSATLPAGMPASTYETPKRSPAKSGKPVSRNESFTGALQTAASGFFSKFRQLKDSMSTPSKGSMSSSPLPKPYEMEKHLYEEEEEKRSSSLDLISREGGHGHGDAPSQEETPPGVKNRVRMKAYSPFGRFHSVCVL